MDFLDVVENYPTTTTHASFFSSNSHSLLSTGYLEDALTEFSFRFKRRRFSPFLDVDVDPSNLFNDDLSYWTTNYREEEEEAKYATQHACMQYSLEEIVGESGKKVRGENGVVEMKTSEEATWTPSSLDCSSSKNSSPCGEGQKRKTRATTRVAYPFAMVKPGGVDGDVTLNDINERILMPPTRPVRHPVGDYACRPCIFRPDGPGLSGKAVVALTKIHTQGRGTITIIRTKG